MNGVVIFILDEIEEVFFELYFDMFGIKIDSIVYVCSSIVRKGCLISKEDREWLCIFFIVINVKNLLWQIEGGKVLGFDGYFS